LISKSDGSSLYITRDIAAAIYRSEEFKADKLLYVVGNEQSLHFKQLQRVLNKMNENIEIVHINFGLVMQNGKKMSTRTGDVQTLDYVLNEAIHMAKNSIEQKNPKLSNKEKVAEKIAMSAIVYNDLKNEKHLNIDFNLANMLKFEGQTGPYLQYTSVRMSSLLQKIDSNLVLEMNTIIDKSVFKLGLYISRIDEAIEKAYSENQPSVISRFAFELAQMFNSWYGNSKIITDNLEKTKSNLSVVYASKKNT
jgi:arginyl-tRNA synthetase